MGALAAVDAWIAVPAGVGLALAWRAYDSISLRRRAAERLVRAKEEAPALESTIDPVRTGLGVGEPWSNWLERWLYVAGFRGEAALRGFLVLESLALLVGAALTFLVARAPFIQNGAGWLLEIPGGLGELFAPVLLAAPWIVFLLFAFLPIARVRARRRAIVQGIERDLPIALALLATLVETGMGLDAALDRLVRALAPGRPLERELRQFRAETQAGIPRAACFRGLALRVDLAPVSTFTSAMIHAEGVGGGVAESLRRQADEVWNRRRERAIQQAQVLPTKLSVPLVLCFLPGLFVFTFGPALAEFLRLADGVISGAR